MNTARFWTKVNVTESCWLWLGHVSSNGYGSLRHNGKQVKAHRFSYERARGPIPEGLQLDHLCRVRSCVNPAHLEIVTQRENILRGVSPIAGYAKRTACPKGHPYDLLNVRPSGRRSRECRECRKQAIRDWKAKNADKIAAWNLANRKRRAAKARERYAKRIQPFRETKP